MCYATLSYLQLTLGVLLPTLAAARSWAPPNGGPAGAAEQGPEQAATAAPHAHPRKRLAAWGARAAAAANALLCRPANTFAEAAGMLYWVLAFLWCQCRLAAMRSA